MLGPFNHVDALRHALRVLGAPPVEVHIVRPETTGTLVGTWTLPLELCPTLNALAEMESWARKRIKTRALALMLAESGGRLPQAPLPGRPIVRALRLSSVEPDRDSGWPKVPIDRLCVGKRAKPKHVRPDVWHALAARMPPVGLGWLRDDRPRALDLRAWWEPAPPGDGLVYLELWTGEPATEVPLHHPGRRLPRAIDRISADLAPSGSSLRLASASPGRPRRPA